MCWSTSCICRSWRKIEADSKVIRVGAAVRQAELLSWPELKQKQPLLAAALPWVGHAQTRSRGTVCGSVAHADPSAELPLVLLALKGTVHLSSQKEKRRVPAGQFFTGMMSTTRKDDELIEAIEAPCATARSWLCLSRIRPPPRRFRHRRLRGRGRQKRRAACRRRRRRPVGARDLPDLTGTALDDALDALAWELDARDDLHATATYRRNLVRQLGRATIEEARRCRA